MQLFVVITEGGQVFTVQSENITSACAEIAQAGYVVAATHVIPNVNK